MVRNIIVRRHLVVERWILGKRDSGDGGKERDFRKEAVKTFADMAMDFLNARWQQSTDVSQAPRVANLGNF